MATRAAKLALRGKALSDTGTEIGIVNNADATAITVDSNENVGIGVTPQANWHSNYDAVAIGEQAVLYAHADGIGNDSATYLGTNVYENSGAKYLRTDESSLYRQQSGKHDFYVAPSGSADAAISWTTAMTIDNAGKVGIGNTASGFNGQADNLSVGTGSGANGITIYSGNDSSGNIFFADGTSGDDPTRGGINYNHANNSISFRVNDAPKMVIDSSGNMGIKQTTPVNLLHIGGADGDSYARFTSDSTGHTSGDGTRIGLNGTDFRIVNHEASNILFLTSNTERMSVSDTTVKHNGQSQLGSGWSQLKQYNWSGSIAQGAYVDLFENSGAHNDLMFYFFVKGYHSNRTFGVLQGSVGGYGLGYTWTGATGMNLSPSVSNAGSGRNKLRMTNGSAYSGSFYITGWLAGDSGITVHTGSLAG